MKRSAVYRSIALVLFLVMAMVMLMAAGTALAAETPGALNQVRLITGQELELVYSQPIITAEQASQAFTVYVDGQKAEFDFLSYFAEGEYAKEPVVNLRLKTPLVSGAHTYHTITEDTAKRLVVEAGGKKVTATWVPYYTFTDEMVEGSSKAVRSNRGSRGMMWVWGNENSRCSDASTVNVPTKVPNRLDPSSDKHYTDFQANYRSAQWVVSTYVTAAIDRTVGRSEQLVNAANAQGMRVVVVGNGQSVYTVPEYRQLYVHGKTTDWATRVTIGGSREIPVIVTTAEDVCRVKGGGAAFSDCSFEMMREFSRLFLKLGVEDGWSKFVLGLYDEPDSYNCLKRITEAYTNAKSKKLWPGTDLLNSVEDYFVLGTMVYYECLPESSTWQKESFPINTRREMLEYDPDLYAALMEVYGEWEYFVGGGCGSSDISRRWAAPWYKHNQADNFTVEKGKIKKYEPLKVLETNLISASQVELVFNREIKDLDELRSLDNWALTWTPKEDEIIQIGEKNYSFKAGQTYTFDRNSEPQLTMEYYQWKTLTLKVTGNKFNSGFMGSEIGGFTADEIEKAFDSSLTVEQGYKPWFTEDAYYRDLNPIDAPFMGDLGDISGWQADIKDERTSYAVSPKVYDAQTPEFIQEYHLVKAKPIPREDFYGKPSALEKGEYIRFDAKRGGYVAYDKKNQALNNGKVRIPCGINGSMTVTFKGQPAVADWDGNLLKAGSYKVQLKPWTTQVMRSEKTGVYVYGDNITKKNSLLVGCDYWDYMFSGGQEHLGQRIADGFNFFFYHKNVKTGEYGSAGLDIIGYHNHMYQPPNRRSLYNTSPTVLYAEGLGYGICSSMEYSLLRDYQATRYDHESIMHHEGVHSVEFPGMLYFTDLNFEGHMVWRSIKSDRWLDDNTYAGGSMAEWLATVSTYWFGTMRESVDGSVTGVWTPISTREELYAYDPVTYQFLKKIYYNGETYLDPAKVPGGKTDLPGWDAQGKSINDNIIKWGLSYPSSMNEDRADWGVTNEFRWTSWGAPNQWDINMSFASGSGIRYGSGAFNPLYPERVSYGINHNPYLKEYHYLGDEGCFICFDANGGRGEMDTERGTIGGNFTLPEAEFSRRGYSFSGWKLENSGRVLGEGKTIKPEGNVTLYAQWRKDPSAPDKEEDKEAVSGNQPGASAYSPMAPQHAAGAKVPASASNNSLLLNGAAREFPAAKINGYNWLKLRDLAMILQGSGKQFSISYDAANKIIDIRSGEAYQSIGDELTTKLDGLKEAIASPQQIRIDGKYVSVAAYNIQGYNYLRLRDMAILLNFGVEYAEASGQVSLNLDAPYKE